jgi:group I intron endonuclease
MYVGSGITNERWSDHKSRLKHNKHPSKAMQLDYNLYGIEAFEFKVLKLEKSKTRRLAWEQYWLNRLECVSKGYNTREFAGRNIGNTNFIGQHHTEETKLKIAKVHTGRVCSPETLKKMRESAKARHARSK